MNLNNPVLWQWMLVGASGIILFAWSPVARSFNDFFKATQSKGNPPSMWLLTSSLVISWIFAKSITNAANLGLKYGIVGGVAYATYYLSFLFAGVIIYRLRVIGGFTSIHHFIREKFGPTAIVLFSVLIAFRLFNEVWSNTMVIGSYFGAIGSASYYLAIVVFTILTLAYSLKGGLKSSLFTDGIQMLLFGCLLIIILTMVLPKGSGSTMFQSGDWSLSGGVDLLLVALLQGFSYPFHDPVMTDRGFIADAKTTLRSFLIAVPIGFVAIVFFSLIGVYAMQMGIVGQAAVQVAQVMGTLTMLAMNLIMITSASSTLDSTFSSFSKLVLVDLNLGKPTVTNGRKVMALVTVIGTLPILFDPEILAATTISGTMVIGLAPVFACWQIPVSSGAFVASVVTGVFFGLVYTLGLYPSFLVFSMGDYGALLSVNLLGTFCCFIVFFAFKWVK